MKKGAVIRNISICGVVFLLTIAIQNASVLGTYENLSENWYILLTGFEPFYIYEVNPSQLIVESLNGTIIGNMTVIGLILPVNFSESVLHITHAIQTYDPKLVLSLGLNGEARMVQVENIGLNLKKRPRVEPFWFFPKFLDPTGPFFIKTSFPTREIVTNIRTDGIAVRQSYYAGTYVCNAVFYQTLRFIDTNDLNIPMGFIHVPPLDYQASYGMNLTVLVDAIYTAIATILNTSCS